MADVQFTEEVSISAHPRNVSQGPLISWLVRSGWAKDMKQAEYLLISVAVVAFATMIGVLMFSSLRPRAVPPNPLEQGGISSSVGPTTGELR